MGCTKHSSSVDLICDVLKALRARALSCPQIQRELGYSVNGVGKNLKRLESQGLLAAWVQNTERGRPARVYALASQWGGTVAKTNE